MSVCMCVRMCVCENVSGPLTQRYHRHHMGDVGERKPARKRYLRKDREGKKEKLERETVIWRTEQVSERSKTSLQSSSFSIIWTYKWLFVGRYCAFTWEKYFVINAHDTKAFGERKGLKQKRENDFITNECGERSESFPQRHPPSPLS